MENVTDWLVYRRHDSNRQTNRDKICRKHNYNVRGRSLRENFQKFYLF